MFSPAGDGRYGHGVISQEEFHLGEGITVEVWGRVPFTDQPHWQDWLRGFTRDRPPEGEASQTWHPGRELPYFHLHRTGILVGAWSPTEQGPPLPDEVDDWHLYALQIDRDGRVSLIVDGRLHWRGYGRASWDRRDPVRLYLDGNTTNTHVRFETVRVYRGERWVEQG